MKKNTKISKPKSVKTTEAKKNPIPLSGGQAVFKKHGVAHMSMLGRRGAAKRAANKKKAIRDARKAAKAQTTA